MKIKKQLNIARINLKEESYPRFSVENIRGLKNYAQFIDSASSLTFRCNVFFQYFYFVVSILVSLTTLTRMIDENRINIGTLKSLGCSNYLISKKVFCLWRFINLSRNYFRNYRSVFYNST